MTINEFRKSKQMTVEEFAKKMGYSISAISKIMCGEREMSNRFLKKLKCEYPDANIDDFFAN